MAGLPDDSTSIQLTLTWSSGDTIQEYLRRLIAKLEAELEAIEEGRFPPPPPLIRQSAIGWAQEFPL